MSKVIKCTKCHIPFKTLKVYKGNIPKCFNCRKLKRYKIVKVIINQTYGGFCFSDEFVKHLEEKGYTNLKDIQTGRFSRHHPEIIKEAELYGLDKISNILSDLVIKTADQGFYHINEYDGKESLLQPSQMIKY